MALTAIVRPRSFVLAHTSSAFLPARTTVISGLPNEDALVEIDALAVVASSGGSDPGVQGRA